MFSSIVLCANCFFKNAIKLCVYKIVLKLWYYKCIYEIVTGEGEKFCSRERLDML